MDLSSMTRLAWRANGSDSGDLKATCMSPGSVDMIDARALQVAKEMHVSVDGWLSSAVVRRG